MDMLLALFKVIVALLLLGLLFSAVKQRNRSAILGNLIWTMVIGYTLFISPPSSIGVAGGIGAFAIYWSIYLLRRQTGAITDEQTYERNKQFFRKFFGRKVSEGYSASVNRMGERQRKADERGVKVVDILKEEYALEKAARKQ